MPKTSDPKGMTERNKHFANDKLGKGFSETGIPSKNPTEALPDTGSHDTPPEKDMNNMRENKGT